MTLVVVVTACCKFLIDKHLLLFSSIVVGNRTYWRPSALALRKGWKQIVITSTWGWHIAWNHRSIKVTIATPDLSALIPL